MARFRIGGGDQAGDPEPVAVVAPGLVRRHMDIGRNVVWRDGGRRWHGIVKAAPFVPDNDEQHPGPLRACRCRVEYARGECFPDLVVNAMLKSVFGCSGLTL